MNRRHFTRALLASAALPVIPMPAMGTGTVRAAAVPKSAQFWAKYMVALHGDATPQALGQITGLPTATAGQIRTALIARNAIKPTDLVTKSAVTARATPAQNVTRLSRWLDHIAVQTPAQTEPVSDTKSM